MQIAISLKQLHHTYAGAVSPALSGFDLEVPKGKITGLLGPNGAGKTTSINIVCGLVKQDKGAATVLGLDCEKDKSVIRRQIGLVPQQIALFTNLTALENYCYIGQLYGLEKKIIKAISAELVEKLGLTKHANKRVGRYSGGMKRRANIIAALLHQPQLLILDEPTAGVDVQSRSLILQFLKEYNAMGHTILYTSHLLDEAEQLCEEVVIVDEGKFVVSGTPDDLIRNTANCRRLEDVFLHYTGRGVRD